MMRVVAAADCMLFKNPNPKKKKGEEGVELLNVSVLKAVVCGKRNKTRIRSQQIAPFSTACIPPVQTAI